MKIIVLITFCIVIASIQTSITGDENTPSLSLQEAPGIFTEKTSIITVIDYGAKGDGVSDDAAAIQSVMDACKPWGATVLFPKGIYRIGSNITLSEYVRFVKGAKLSVDSGATVTISGVIDADIYQIFSGDGTVFLASGSCECVYPQWWGAVGDSVTDCTAAFDSAMTAAQAVGRLSIPSGTYVISSSLNNFATQALGYLDSGMIIEGAGTETVLWYTGTTGYLFQVEAPDPTDANHPIGVTLRDFLMMCPNITDPDDGGGILVTSGPHEIDRVRFGVNNTNATAIHCRARETTTTEDSYTEDITKDLRSGVIEKYAVKVTTPTRATKLHSATLRFKRTGTPGGNVNLALYTNSGDLPNTQVGSYVSETYDIDSISTSGEDLEIQWERYGENPSVSGSTVYWIVVETDAGYTDDGSNYLSIEVDDGEGATTDTAEYNGAAWANPGSAVGANYTIACRYGQVYQVTINECHAYNTSGNMRALWLEDDAVVQINNCFFRTQQNIRSIQGYWSANGCYFLNGTTTEYNIYASWGQSQVTGGIIEGGIWYFGGYQAFHLLTGVKLNAGRPTWGAGTGYRVVGCSKDMYLTDDAAIPPDIFQWKVIPADNDEHWNISSSGATYAADSDAMNGNAVQITAQASKASIDVSASGEFYGFLPRGVYRITVWMKDSNQVANDCIMNFRYYSGSWSNVTSNTYTLTADYRPYEIFAKINSARLMSTTNIAKRHQLYVYKATASANTISISHCVWQYLGPDKLGMDNLAVYATDEANTDGARKGGLEFWGTKADENQGALARIEASHDGTGDDHKGELNFMVNTGRETFDTLSSMLRLSTTIDSFADGDTTPSVAGGNIFTTANTGSTTITMFDDGVTGKQITVIFGDSNTTVDFTGTNLKGNGGMDWSPNTNDHMTCVYDGAKWYCSISDNTP